MSPHHEACSRFKERILMIGLLQKDQIEELRDPTLEALEKKLKWIEKKIDDAGRQHNLNTFFMLYFVGVGALNEERQLEIRLLKE